MKKVLVLFLFLLGAYTLEAQIKTAAPSPAGKIEQVVGLTDVKIEYSRPGKKERNIFGDLVPYGEMWRTGANKNTMISFSNDVMINGEKLEKGTYAIFVKPSEKNWEVNFYTDTENWGTPEKWDPAKVALTTSAVVNQMPMPMETFTMDIGDLTSSSAVISFLWDTVWVGLDLTVNTNEMVEASIEKTMAGPGWYENYQAGRYYLENTDDTDKAVSHLERAVAGKGAEKFWVMRQYALAQAKKGMVKEAMATLATSTELAIKADNKDYPRLNEKTLAAWKAMK